MHGLLELITSFMKEGTSKDLDLQQQGGSLEQRW